MTRFRKKTFMEDRRSVRLRRFFWLLGIALLFPQKQMHQTHEDYRSRRKVCGTQAILSGIFSQMIVNVKSLAFH